jgi:hypothetical protein
MTSKDTSSVARCSQLTKRGERCKRPAFVSWSVEWPEQVLSGTCRAHMHPADREVLAAGDRPSLIEDGLQTGEDSPACWSWRVQRTVGWGSTGSPSNRALIDELVEWQQGRCAICGEHRNLVCDHDHETGMVRGFLCGRCNTMEGSSPLELFENYRTRPPAAILNIRAKYWDPNLGEYASAPADFDPWASAKPGPCGACGSPPFAVCACPPAYRLNSRRVLDALIGPVLAAAGLGVNGIKHVIRDYQRRQQLSPEQRFVRDMLLLPRSDYVVDRWFGGWQAAQRFGAQHIADVLLSHTGESEAGNTRDVIVPEHFKVDEQWSGDAIVPAQYAGRFVAGLALVMPAASGQSDSVLCYVASLYVAEWGMAFTEPATEDLLLTVSMTCLGSTAKLLGYAADCIESGHWCADTFGADELAGSGTALRRDNEMAAEFLRLNLLRAKVSSDGETVE